MKKQIFALMVSVAVCETCPVFASDMNPNDGGIDIDVWRSRRVEKKYEHGSTCTTEWYTEKQHVYPFHQETLTMSDEMFESLASTGRYQTGNKLYTVDNIEGTKEALAFYRENQNDTGEIASRYHKQWLENNFESYKNRVEGYQMLAQAYPDFDDDRINFEYENGMSVYTGPVITLTDMEKDYPTPRPVKFIYCLAETIPAEQDTIEHVLIRRIDLGDSTMPIALYRVKVKEEKLSQ